MTDAQKNGWDVFAKSGRIEDYLKYKGYKNAFGAIDPPQAQNAALYARGQTDGGKTPGFDNTRK